MKKLILTIGSLFFTITSFASQISVYPMTVNFWPAKNKFQDLIVMNNSPKKAYVTVTLQKIVHPGTPQEKKIDIANNPLEFGLVASPSKIVIPMKQARRIRLLPLIHNNTKDVIYNALVQPAEGELESMATKDKKIQAGIRIIIGYGIRVAIRPLNAHPILKAVRDGHEVTVTNTGNTNVVFVANKQCDSSNKNCKTFSSKRMYAGNVWKYHVPYETPVHLTYRFNKKYINIESN